MIKNPELTDQERLDMYEMNRLEGNEIKGEHLNELDAKGYEIVHHGDEACFWCTINLLIGGLPDRNPSPSPHLPEQPFASNAGKRL